jgi:HK97 gp10 family phage protein
VNGKFRGVEALKRKLAALPKVAIDEMQKAMAESADEIVDMARRLVPVDQGDLRDSIGWTFGDPPKGAIVLGHVKRTGFQQARQSAGLLITIFAGNDKAFYARWVEFGTQDTPAKPFFYPSYRAQKKRAKSRIRRSQTRAAKRVAAS